MEKLSYPLEERTLKFAEAVIDYCKTIPVDHISRNLISQLMRSSTSIAANYAEANGASSKKDFRSKIAIGRKESQETKVWLRLMMKCHGQNEEQRQKLFQEAHELVLIFGKIFSSLKENC